MQKDSTQGPQQTIVNRYRNANSSPVLRGKGIVLRWFSSFVRFNIHVVAWNEASQITLLTKSNDKTIRLWILPLPIHFVYHGIQFIHSKNETIRRKWVAWISWSVTQRIFDGKVEYCLNASDSNDWYFDFNSRITIKFKHRGRSKSETMRIIL